MQSDNDKAPVYLINGFIDCGKTTFIKELIETFNAVKPGKVLLIACEDGEEEYDDAFLSDNNTVLIKVEEETDFNRLLAEDLEKEICPDRIIVEYNGMWSSDSVHDIWPADDKRLSETVLIDTSMFGLQLRNFKSFVADQVRTAELVIFDRCDGLRNRLGRYRRNVRALNRNTKFAFKDENGSFTMRFVEDLPYDINSDSIILDDESFASFYVDAVEYPDSYIGKIVRFSGIVLKAKTVEATSFLVGRLALTCCADDLTVFGFICDTTNNIELNVDDWVEVTGTFDKEYSERYGIWHPVFNVMMLRKTEAGNKVINVN